MMKFLFGIVCFVLMQLQAMQVYAQFITSAPQLVGLSTTDGRELLPRAYESIKPLDGNMETYLCKDQFHRYGLFHVRHGFILPCMYDEIFKEGYFYLLKSGKHHGWMRYEIENDKPAVTMQEPVFDALKKMNGSEYLIRLDGKSGIVQFRDSARLIIPIQYSEPIRHTNQHGYHFSVADDIIAVLLPADAEGRVTEIIDKENHIFMDEYFLWTISYIDSPFADLTNAHDSTRIYDVRNGKLLGTFYTANYPIPEYRRDCRCLELISRISKRKYEVKLINPYDGQVFYQNILDWRTRIEFDGFVTRRDLNVPAEIILNKARGKRHTRIHVGTLVGYTYVPDNTPRVEKVVYSGSSGKKPFFMPGKD